jgi:hypothetical protein
LVNKIIDSFKKGSSSLGMKFEGEPVWIEVPDDRQLQKDGCKNTRNGGNFNFCIDNMLKPI